MGYIEHLHQNGFPDAKKLMETQIATWWGWYVADNDFYSSTDSTTVDGVRRVYKVDRISIKPARMVCQEWASLLLNERTTVATGNDVVNEWLKAELARNRFFDNGQRLVERAFALGTGAWALRVEGLIENASISPDARIVPQRFDARQIIPLTYDEDRCTECAFTSEAIVRGSKYSQLQVHRLNDDGTYRIETYFFDKNNKLAMLQGIAPAIETHSTVPLFALARPGLENTYADYSPFGVSVFDDGLGAVKLVDEAIDNMHRDIWLGQKLLFLDERMLEKDASGNISVPRSKDQQLFRKTEVDSGAQMVEEYNPDLRVSDNRLALRSGLELLGSRCGLGSDYFSLEGASGVKTATEVIADDSDLFRNVRKHENALAPAIQTIIAGIISLARTVKGLPLPEEYGEIRVAFDDSVIEDTDAQRKRDREDVAAMMMQPWEYRMKWYGEDEDTARAMIDGGPTPPAE